MPALNPPRPYHEKRPWGGFVRFVENSPVTVKLLTVKAGEQFSLQYHEKRDEFWHIISGEGTAVVGETSSNFKPDDEFWISRGTPHRLTAGSSDVVFLEIAFGEFSENEIVRIEDKYGRTNPQ
jgi:mannose-6-phosphate isomerase-like protein (cupin superfamily)